MSKVLILNYHSIISSPSIDFNDPIYSIDELSFTQQLEIIKKLEMKVILVSEISKYEHKSKTSIAITFDDGHDSDFNIAYPKLNEYGFKATFYIPTSKLEGDSLKIKQYQQILADGHQIGPHGKTHTYLSDLNYKEQLKELAESKETLESITNEKAIYFSLPGGKYNKKTLEISKELGFKGLLTTKFGFNDINDKSILLKRWTIKKSTSIDLFEKIVCGNRLEVKKLLIKSFVKKWVFAFLSNRLIDKINYKLRG